MDAEHANVAAGIGQALAAGLAAAAGQVGHDVDRVALAERAPGRSLLDRTGQFVSHDARIIQERVLALEDVVVRTADADMADGDARPAVLERLALDSEVVLNAFEEPVFGGELPQP